VKTVRRTVAVRVSFRLSDAAGIPRSRMIHAIKAIEYPRQVLLGNARSVVADFDRRP